MTGPSDARLWHAMACAWQSQEISMRGVCIAMLGSLYLDKCSQCAGRMIDTEDEVVCSSCGVVTLKDATTSMRTMGSGSLGERGGARSMVRRPHAVDYTIYALGSFLGPLSNSDEEEATTGLRSSSSAFRYLKTISDYSQREEPGIYQCARLIERTCEKLSLPNGIIGQAVKVSRALLDIRKQRTGYTIAAISAFSIISACRIYDVTSVGVKEVVEAHRAMGHRIKPSTLIRMGFDSPIRARARKAEDYLGRVEARLSETLPSFGAPLGYQNRLLHVARRLLCMLDSAVRGGHSPCALAATSFYAAEMIIAKSEARKRFFTQRDVAVCVNVAEYTVREQFCRLFRPHFEEMYEEIKPLLLQNPGCSNRIPQPVQPLRAHQV